MPTTSPALTTGRCRNPWSSIVLRASSTCSSGPIVIGSCVIHDETSCEGASWECEIARTVSRSVKMPASLVPSMTSIEPTRCWAMSATASPTVVEGLTVNRVSLMTSLTVAMGGFYAWPGGIGKAASMAVATRTMSTSATSARAYWNPRRDHDQDSGRLQAQNQAIRRPPQVIEPAQLLGCPQHPGQGRDREGQERDPAKSLDHRAPFVSSPPVRGPEGGEHQDAAGPRSGRQNMRRVREDRARGGIDRGGVAGKGERR